MGVSLRLADGVGLFARARLAVKLRGAVTMGSISRSNGLLDRHPGRYYTLLMITFDAAKRLDNLASHGIDLAACEPVFDSFMRTTEDRRLAYGEQRLQSLGWLVDRVVFLVWVDRPDGPHVISCRAGTKHETQRYFQAIDQP